MATKVVGIGDKALNIFTRYGRERNHLYSELRRDGIKHIVDRKLPNNSHVILGYVDKDSKYAKYAFKVNSALSLEQKTSYTKTILNLFGEKDLLISKIWANNEGEQIGKEVKNIRYRNNHVAGKTKSAINDKTNIAVAIFENEGVNILSGMSSDKISKIYKRTNLIKPDTYEFIQYTDGTREYKKFIDGVEYRFSTK